MPPSTEILTIHTDAVGKQDNRIVEVCLDGVSIECCGELSAHAAIADHDVIEGTFHEIMEGEHLYWLRVWIRYRIHDWNSTRVGSKCQPQFLVEWWEVDAQHFAHLFLSAALTRRKVLLAGPIRRVTTVTSAIRHPRLISLDKVVPRHLWVIVAGALALPRIAAPLTAFQVVADAALSIADMVIWVLKVSIDTRKPICVMVVVLAFEGGWHLRVIPALNYFTCHLSTLSHIAGSDLHSLEILRIWVRFRIGIEWGGLLQ